jgi:hypothetical protein
MSKREPKHIGEVMSDIAERYNKLTKTKMSKEELDNFLLKLLNADKVGIRRKLIAMKNFLEENTILLNQMKDEDE